MALYKNNAYLFLSLLLVGACISDSPTPSRDVYVKDGDNFILNDEEVRLWGIDAPEFNQECVKNQVP